MSRLALALALAVALGGCMSVELARVQRDVRRDLPHARLADAHAFALGRLSMALVRSAAGRGDDAALTHALRHVRGASFGRYAVRGSFDPERAQLPRMLDRARRRGWTPAVVARDDSTATWILTRDRRDGTLGDLLVATLTDEELVLVRVHGRLEGVALAFLNGADAPVALGPVGSIFGADASTREGSQ